MQIAQILLLFLFSLSLNAQSILGGLVLDAESGQPLAYANVFVANTSIGTTTDENGAFELSAVPLGQQEIIVSFVAYEALSQSIRVQESTVRDDLRFELKPLAIRHNALIQTLHRFRIPNNTQKRVPCAFLPFILC